WAGRNPMLRPGNTPMLAGLTFVNGYSPMGLVTLASQFHLNAHGDVRPDLLARLPALVHAGLFDRLGIDGALVPAANPGAPAIMAAFRGHGWELVGASQAALILYRKGPPVPRVRAITGALVEGSGLVSRDAWK